MKKQILQAAILKRKPSNEEDEVTTTARAKLAKITTNPNRVPLAVISNKLHTQTTQEQITVIKPIKERIKSIKEQPADEDLVLDDPFVPSYSLLPSTPFYEIPYEETVDDVEEDLEDIRYFGFDLRKHARMLQKREASYLPKQNYLKWQPNLNSKMRMILLHWLSEVCDEYTLQRETWHIAVNYIDRFLSCVPKVSRSRLQLIGVSALLVACKVEEYDWPTVHQLEQLADGACDNKQIIQMEKLLLQKIGWLLLPVTPYIFLRLYLLIYLKSKRHPNLTTHSTHPPPNDNELDCIKQVCKGNNEKSQLIDHEMDFPRREFTKMMQVIDIALMDAISAKFPPSMIAAGVLCLMYITDDSNLLYVTDYTSQQLKECVEWLRPFTGVPMPKSYYYPEEPYSYCLQTSNPNVKVFLENYL